VPISAGGWITDEAYANELLRRGADKLVLNSAFHTDPDLVQRLARRFGRQCIVASIDVKRDAEGKPHAIIDRGRQDTGIAPVEAATRAEALGAGEILFNSVDHDGARKGYDLDTLREICAAVSIPVIAFGGVFKWDDMVEGVKAGADAVAAANIFHYTDQSARAAKRRLAAEGIPVRAAGMSALQGKP
jgi:imidazole glycerol-phosphate synthase subunit HisF